MPYEAVYATTDPVAMDVLGWAIVEQHRKDNGLPTLKDAGREPNPTSTPPAIWGSAWPVKNRISLREVRI